MGIISIENLTKDYGKGRGVFDVSLHVECIALIQRVK